MGCMQFLSFLEFKNETVFYQLSKKIAYLEIPKNLFVRAALGIAKSVQHLAPEFFKTSTSLCIETVDRFLRGEATEEECRIAASAAFADAATATATATATAAAGYAAYAATAYAGYAAYAATADAAYAASAASAASDIFREHFPWEWVCGSQIAQALNRKGDEKFILEVSQNKKLVNYATMILSEPSMHPSFEFFMVEYQKNRL